MVEAGSKEVSEEDMLQAILFGHEKIKELIAFQEEIIKEVGKEKEKLNFTQLVMKFRNEVLSLAKERLIEAIKIEGKLERYGAIDAINEEVINLFDERTYKDEKEKRNILMQVKDVLHDIEKEEVRRLITIEKKRPDGRGIDEIRPLNAQKDILPRVHGSALFTRGETQVLSVTTLGAIGDQQILDNLSDEETKRFMHHYNMPPYSVGETGRIDHLEEERLGMAL